MVASHFGVYLSGESAVEGFSVLWALTCLGSYAPVLFFFCTGAGYGSKAPQSLALASLVSLFYKCFLLVLADHFLRVTSNSFFGLDFLAFIGILTLVCGALASSRRGLWVACGMVSLLLLMRFASKRFGIPDGLLAGPAAWAFGVVAVRGVSYPLTPWLCYGLLGFIVARVSASPFWASSNSAGIVRYSSLLFWLGGAFLIVSAFFARHGVNFRWGTVSATFFIFSLVSLLLFSMLATLFNRFFSEVSILGFMFHVRGVVALIVVPVHYLLIGVLDNIDGRVVFCGLGLLSVYFLLVGLVIAASKFIASAIERYAELLSPKVEFLILLAVLCSLSIAASGFWRGAGFSVHFSHLVIGQVAICALLFGRNYRRVQR